MGTPPDHTKLSRVSKRTKQRLVLWFFFGVLSALAPFAFHWMVATESDHALGIQALVSHGELLLISSAIAALGMGDVLLHIHPRFRMPAYVVAGCSLVVVLLSSSYYGAVVTGARPSAGLFSTILFALSLGVGAASIIAADRAKGRS